MRWAVKSGPPHTKVTREGGTEQVSPLTWQMEKPRLNDSPRTPWERSQTADEGSSLPVLRKHPWQSVFVEPWWVPGSPPFRSHFSWVLGEPQVSGTDFSQHAEKGPTDIYLITINRCIAWASWGSFCFFCLLLLICFNWTVVDLQYCVSFRCRQNDSVTHTLIYIYPFFFRFFSITAYYKILNIVPCAIQ